MIHRSSPLLILFLSGNLLGHIFDLSGPEVWIEVEKGRQEQEEAKDREEGIPNV